MADNVSITAGAGTVIGTDEVTIGGVAQHVQRMKLVDGTDGGTDLIPGTAAKGLSVDPRGSTAVIQTSSAGLTTATTAYSAGDQLGTELSFASAVRLAGGTGRVESALLMDKAKVVAGVDLYLFDRSVVPAADNAAFAFSDADMMFCQGVIEFRAAKSGANNAVLLGLGLPIVVKPNVTTLFGHLVTQSGHTFFGAAGDLVVTLGIAQD